MKKFTLLFLCLSAVSFAQTENPQETDVEPSTSLEAVVVTSDLSKQASPLVTAPGNYVQKNREALKEKSSQSLEGLLNIEPNVEFVGGPRSSAELPQIRGLGSDRILVLDEGVRQNFQSGHNGRVFTDFSLVENLEVVKGPWSALYGSGAMGGVISFRKSTAGDYIKRSGQNSGVEFGVDAGSAGDQLGGRVTAFTKSGIFEPLVSYRKSKNNDLRLGTGERLEYSASESQDLYSSLGFRFAEKSVFHLKLNRRTETAVLPLNPVTETNVPNQLGDTTNIKEDIVGDYVFDGGNVEFHAKPYFRKTQVRKERVSDSREDIQTVSTIGIDTWNNWKQTHSENFKSTTTLGLEYFQDRNKGERNGAALSTFPNASSSQAGLYLQPTLVWNEKWSLIPGLRVDSFERQDSTGVVEAKKGSRTSSKLYASYEYAKEKVIFAGWGQAFNAPRVQDLFAQGMHFPGNFFVPNPDLQPETAETVEVGTKSRSVLNNGQVLSYNATYFRTQAKDFIVQDVGATTTTFRNVDRVRLEGVEISGQWQLTEWGFGASYGQVRSSNEITDESLADTPADQWGGQVQYLIGETMMVGTDLKWAQKQDRLPPGAQDTPSYFTQDYYFGYTTRKVEAQLRVNNAYDREYRRHASGIEELGRDVRLNVSYLF